MSPDEALRLALNQPDGTPVLEEFQVTGKPFPVWPIVAGLALLIFAVASQEKRK